MKQEIGIISNWNEEKGFGFIKPSNREGKLFFHINDYSNKHKRPILDLRVSYHLSTDQKGRTCAVDVTPVKGHKNNGKGIGQRLLSLVLVVFWGGVLFIFHHERLVPTAILCIYPLMSFIAFLAYAKDKHAAQVGKWRTSENTLHILSVFGGWPGAKIAQSFLRHKSQKISFRVTYWITVCINCAALYWLTTPEGIAWIKKVMKNVNMG
nr:cold shock and DUF1294 domain-containing protein [uncultured Desulfobacter sp.]